MERADPYAIADLPVPAGHRHDLRVEALLVESLLEANRLLRGSEYSDLDRPLRVSRSPRRSFRLILLRHARSRRLTVLRARQRPIVDRGGGNLCGRCLTLGWRGGFRLGGK